LFESGKKNARRRWLTHYAPLVVWIVVILGLGSSIGSMNETSRFIRPLLEFLFPTAAPETLTYVHGMIRKSAHFVEYAILSILAARAFGTIFRTPILRFLFAFLLVAMIASVDEYQQSFNPSRTSSPFDVLIDLSGGVAALLIFAAITARWRRSAKSIEP
jgi:VanZ family protein